MARTIDEIFETLKTAYVSEMAAISLTVDPLTWSKTNLQRLMLYVVAFCTFALETLFDLFRIETDDKIALLKPHTKRWYAQKSEAFQYGFTLIPDTDQFDNTGATDEDIEDSKIVDYAAVVEQMDQFNRVFLRFKLAKDNGTDLEALTTDEVDAFTSYMQQIKDAGVRVIVNSFNADSIKQTWRVYYDPLLLTNDGSRIDGSSATPVQDAIKNYLKNLPFNGIYVPQYHIDAVQSVPGVVICELDDVSARYGSLDFTPVITQYTPDAGYLRFDSDSDLVITFIAQEPIK